MVRMRCGTTARERIVIIAKDEDQALARYWRLRSMVDALVKAKRGPEAVVLVKEAASQRTDRAFGGVERAALDLADTPLEEAPAPVSTVTYGEVVRQWLSGELAALHPGEVREKSARTVEQQWFMYTKRILSATPRDKGPLKDRPIDTITVDDLEEVKRSLPKKLGGSYRRHYCTLIAKPLQYAEYPLRLIERSPVPKGFIPSRGKTRAFTYLYPDEEAQALRCARIPLEERVMLGLIARNGMRISEAVGLTLGDLDMRRGNLSLDVNKTRSPRAWKLDPDCVRALRIWMTICPPAGPDSRLFPNARLQHAAIRYRTQLKWAKVGAGSPTRTRELFATTAERRPIRVHDLRASFVTLALAAGRGAPTTELWVRDRTGHTTPKQMETYRRWSRFALDNEQGWFAPLDEAIPELAEPAKGGRVLLAEALSAPSLVGHEVGHGESLSMNSATSTRAPCSVEGALVHSRAPKTSATDARGDTSEHGGPPRGGQVGHVLAALETLSPTELQRVAARCRSLLRK